MKRSYIIIILLFFVINNVYAQRPGGPPPDPCTATLSATSASFDCSGGTETFTIDLGIMGLCSWDLVETETWFSVSPSSGTGDTFVVTCDPTSSSGTVSGVILVDLDGVSNDVEITITRSGVQYTTVGTVTQVAYCDYVNILKPIDSDGIYYYWQTSANGTSMSDSRSTMTKSNGESYTLYLRAYNSNNCGGWGPAKVISGTAPSNPAAPLGHTDNSSCDISNLMLRQDAPEFIATPDSDDPYWFWQLNSTSLATDNPYHNGELWDEHFHFEMGPTGEFDPKTGQPVIGPIAPESFTVREDKSYYLRYRDDRGCWSAPSLVSVDVKEQPLEPAPFEPNSDSCEFSELIHPNNEDNMHYYWQSAAGSYDTSNGDPTFSITHTQRVYLRAKRTDIADCWGPWYDFMVPVEAPLDITISGANAAEDEGTEIILTANSALPYTYTWEDNENLLQTAGQSVDVLFKNSSSFIVHGESGSGCKSSDTLLVAVRKKPIDVTISVSGTTLTANPVCNEGAVGYLWNTGATTKQITIPDTKGIYSVRVKDLVDESESTKIHNFTTSGPSLIGYNYVRSQTVHISGITSHNAVNHLTEDSKDETYRYIDGLGRPMQDIAVKASPESKDIVKIYEYDPVTGRQVKQYLPYTIESLNGVIRESTMEELDNFYFAGTGVAPIDEHYYSETRYEESPFGRVLAQGAPGDHWRVPDNLNVRVTGENHFVKYDYQTNGANEIKHWIVNSSGDCVLSGDNGGYYLPGTLYKTKVTDEHNKPVYEYKDFDGKTILKTATINTKDSTGTTIPQEISTYYVYDVFNRLAYVIPPKAVAEIGSSTSVTSDILYELMYFYKYDDRGRLMTKHIPGSDDIRYVYDKLDRIVMSQDGNLAGTNQWSFIKYDKLGRAIMSGIVTTTDNRDALQIKFSGHSLVYEVANASAKGYTIDRSTPSGISIGYDDLLTVSYYDNYDHQSAVGGYTFAMPTGFSATSYMTEPLGAVTGSLTRVVDSDEWLITSNYYDIEGRLIQSCNENHLSGVDIISNEYDFAGKLLKTKKEHEVDKAGYKALNITEKYDYDHAGRLTDIKHQLGDNSADEITMSQYEYNELGQVMNKKLHSDNDTTFLQSVDYGYNERGWLTGINPVMNSNENDLFTMQLSYQDPFGSNDVNAYFNGNISAIQWKTVEDDVMHGYAFEYDDMNRLLGATYAQDDFTQSSTNYHVEHISYDENGNIQSVWRKGDQGQYIDKLTYDYWNNGNLLKAVTDAIDVATGNDFQEITELSEEYSYDPNGNMVDDANKGKAFAYNHLNLLASVDNSLAFTYDALGNKLTMNQVTGTTTNSRFYVGNMIYNYTMEDSSGTVINEEMDLGYILTPEGRIVQDNEGYYHYEYFLRDHLGNVRVSFADYDDNDTAEVLQTNGYYPFGMVMDGLNTYRGTTNNNYLYNGKELHEEEGVDFHDYGWRMYDAQLGRWHVKDNYSEAYIGLSPYNYVLNNPMSYIDPNGEFALLALLVDAVETIFNGGLDLSNTEIMKDAWADFDPTTEGTKTNNALKMDLGLFVSQHTTWLYWDESADWNEAILQVGNKVANGEILQTSIGYAYGHIKNIMGDVENVGFYEDRVIVRFYDDAMDMGLGVSYGHFIFGEDIAFSPDDTNHDVDLFAHEFGHTYQSRIAGPSYLFKYGIPSVTHGAESTAEADADYRAYENLGIWPHGRKREPNRMKWWEFMMGPLVCLWNY